MDHDTLVRIELELQRHLKKNPNLQDLPDYLKDQEIQFYTLANSANSVEDSLDHERAANHYVDSNSGKKKLREINILSDGINGQVWKNTEEGFAGLNKLDTLKQLIFLSTIEWITLSLLHSIMLYYILLYYYTIYKYYRI
jgi:hypothetical protein